MRPAVSPLAGVPPATRVPFYSPLGDPHAPGATKVDQFVRSALVCRDFRAAGLHSYPVGRAQDGGLRSRHRLAHTARAGWPRTRPRSDKVEVA
jgi:hypothetical protein